MDLLKPSKLLSILEKTHEFAGAFPHRPGWDMTSTICRLCGPEVTIIAPKMLHTHFEERGVTAALLSPAMARLHPPTTKYVLLTWQPLSICSMRKSVEYISGFALLEMRMEAENELAWRLYCKETAGDMDVKDFWDELPERAKLLYLKRVRKGERP